jgi:uncharacterized membrane protein YdjX (TVP38/TMEM64 family)
MAGTAVYILLVTGMRDNISIDILREKRHILNLYIKDHYFTSIFIFFLFSMSNAFFIPAAVLATISGGFLFGFIGGAVLVNSGLTAGSVLAFLLSRYMIGD